MVSAELISARACAVAAEAEVKRSASEVSKLGAQVKDLQEALQAASRPSESPPQTQSNKMELTSAELRSAHDKSTAALQRAAAAEAEVQTLTAQVEDLHKALQAASQASDPSNSTAEGHSPEAVNPRVDSFNKWVDDSIMQQVHRASAAGGAAIAALTQPKSNSFHVPSRTRSAEALPLFTKARHPSCGSL